MVSVALGLTAKEEQVVLSADQWQTLELQWDARERTATLRIEGDAVASTCDRSSSASNKSPMFWQALASLFTNSGGGMCPLWLFCVSASTNRLMACRG